MEEGRRQVGRDGWALVALLALIRVALHLVFYEGYGYFRDELYYLACADHLAWGYVDHPPLSIAVLAGIRAVLGDSLFALRLLPALLGGVAVFVTGMLAREMGGGRYAQFLAALAALFTPIFLAMGTFYSMNSIEQTLWPLMALVLVRIVNTGNGRLWLLFGLVAGLALLNKLGTSVYGIAIVAGLALTPQRRWFASKWLYLGGTVAFLVVLPHLVWQVTHDWPFLEFVANAKAYKMAAVSAPEFVMNQVLIVNPGNLLVWVPGLLYLLLAKSAANRIFGIAFLVSFLLFMAQQGKSYYLAPAYPMVFAGGGLAWEVSGRRKAWGWARVAAPTAVTLFGLVLVPYAVPVLPPATAAAYMKRIGVPLPKDERGITGLLPQHFADRYGWEEMVKAISDVYNGLSPEEQAQCGILCGNYGEAGAVDFFGPRYGLPSAISTHNSYWHWGSGDADGSVLIVIGYDAEELAPLFESVEEKAVVRSEYAMPYESNRPVFVCRGLKVSLQEVWDKARNFI